MVTLKLTLEEAQTLLYEVQFAIDTNENEVPLGFYEKEMYDHLLSVKTKLEAAEDFSEYKWERKKAVDRDGKAG
jgi:hypothetical protein